jgi:2-methylcitrate dehydratase PrpD
MTPNDTLTHRLARFASSLRYDDLPLEVVTMTKHLVLDTLGTSIAATTLGSGCKEIVQVVSRFGGKKESTVIGHPLKLPAPNAALANGALAHALNYDAIGSEVGHIGVVCLSAALAAAEAVGSVSGREFLTSVAVAAEVTARVSAAIAAREEQRNKTLLRGQFLGYLGAAAGAGRALSLNATEMHSAFGLALMQSSGSAQIIIGGDPAAKSIYGAFPNYGGVLAAFLSKAGLEAECDVLEGPAGIYGMITRGSADYDLLAEELGSDFLLLSSEFKSWPMSTVVHPFIEAALQLYERGRIPEIDTVEIVGPKHVRDWCEPLYERRHPANAAAAADSVIFGVAKALAHGKVTLADFKEDGVRDATAARVADRTTYQLDDRIKGAVVRVTAKEGYRAQAVIDKPFGYRSGPVSKERLVAKFRDCLAYSAEPFTPREATCIIDTVEHLEDITDLASLAVMIGRGA